MTVDEILRWLDDLRDTNGRLAEAPSTGTVNRRYFVAEAEAADRAAGLIRALLSQNAELLATVRDTFDYATEKSQDVLARLG